VLILWGAVIAHGYPAQSWLTFRQALARGGNVRKGEHGVARLRQQFRGAESAIDDEAGQRAIPIENISDVQRQVCGAKKTSSFLTSGMVNGCCRAGSLLVVIIERCELQFFGRDGKSSPNTN